MAGAGLACAGISSGAFAASQRYNSASKRKQFLRWRVHPVAKIPREYQVGVADVNGDGRPDIVALGASTGSVKWYENLGLGS